MPKFQNKDTRSIVDVDDDTAATLGREWAPLGVGLEKGVVASAQAQQRKLSSLLEAAGHASREAKFAHLSELLGRQIKVWKDVGADEADELIDELESGGGSGDPDGAGAGQE